MIYFILYVISNAVTMYLYRDLLEVLIQIEEIRRGRKISMFLFTTIGLLTFNVLLLYSILKSWINK